MTPHDDPRILSRPGTPSADRGPILVAVLAVGLGLVVLLGPSTRPLASKGVYAALHLLLEVPSIALSGAIFLFAWNVRGRDVANWIQPVGAAFFAMALLDTSHILAFPGMPGLLGPPTEHTAITLWLISRAVAFFVLLAIALELIPKARKAHRFGPWLHGLTLVAFCGLLLLATTVMPATYHPINGLTDFKVGAELVLASVGVVAGVAFMRRARTAQPVARRQLHWLAAASFTHVLAELAFTRYAGFTDVANFCGHLLKILGDFAIFQCLFVAAVRAPFIRAQTLRTHQAALLDAMPDPWVVIDQHGVVLEQRRAAPYAFGLGDGLVGTSLATLMAPEAYSHVLEAAKGGRSDGTSRERTMEAPGPNLPGTFGVTVVPLPGVRQSSRSALVLVRDLTARRAAEAQLRIADIAFEAPVALVVLGANGTVLQVNRAFAELTGWGDAVIGQPLHALAATSEEGLAWRVRFDGVHEHGTREARVLVHRRGGEPFHAEQRLSAVWGPDGQISHLVMALRDLTAQREAADAIHQLAYYDGLTGLPNRSLLTDQLHDALRESSESGVEGAVIFLDLDHFKNLNDTRGHDVGDRLLQAVARRLARRVRGQDLVARLGGDEFVVLLRQLDAGKSAEQARAVALSLQAILLEPFLLPLSAQPGATELVHHTSPSIGICLFSDRISVDDLLKRADLAMYQAKDAGRNTVRFYDPALQARLVRRTALAEALRSAMRDGELWIAWQPQVDVHARVIGAEALLRWDHPEDGLISPVDFIPVAEDTGLIVDIGLWVLRSACDLLARWAEDPRTQALRISVNVSARQLYEADFTDRVEQMIEDSGAPAQQLILELTESMVIRGEDRASARLAELEALGVGLSMDDFGTGYSSLALLKRLPITEVKIDRAFVSNLPSDSDDAAIVHAILGIGDGLGLHVIAEGVETEAQHTFLTEAGCAAFQGFLFARPMPIEDLEHWVRCNV